MRYYWIENIESFAGIAQQWDNAVLSARADNPYLLSDFILVWWKHYGSNLGLRIFVIENDSRIVSGIPLCMSRNGRLQHIGGIQANYTEFIAPSLSVDLWDIFSEALYKRNDWHVVQLKRFRQVWLFREPDAIARASGQPGLFFEICNAEPAYQVKIPDNFPGFQESLPKKLRYYLKSALKKTSSLGELRLDSLKTQEEITAAVNTFISFSKTAFKQRGMKSAFEDDCACLFLKELTGRFFKKNILDANVLRLDNRIIAVHFGFSTQNNINYVFTSFDISNSELNPGHLLIYKLIELGSKRGSRIFDMCTGYHLYKNQWSNFKEKVLNIELRPDRLSCRIEAFCLKQARSLFPDEKIKRSLSRLPLILEALRGLKEFMKRFF